MARADTADRLKASPPALAPRFLAVGVLAIYRAAISPVIHAINGPACRFEPSCSAYARDAIAEYGIIRGGAMALWRIARCNPMGGHGYDPVRSRGAHVLSPLPARERMKVRVLVQRIFLGAIRDSASAPNTSAEVMQSFPQEEVSKQRTNEESGMSVIRN